MWETKYFCVECKAQMSYHVKMYSHGRCPYCGYKHPRASTVVKTFERAGRWIPAGKWYHFWLWGKGRWEYKD